MGALVPTRGNGRLSLGMGGHDKIEVIRIGSHMTLMDHIMLRIKSFAMVFNSRQWGIYSGADDSLGMSRDGTYNYRKNAPNGGRNNSIVFAAIKLTTQTFAQSPVQVMQIKDDADEVVPNHEMIKLIAKPNPYYNGKLMWRATIADWMFGNAYWIKNRNGAGVVKELYWVPATQMSPKWNQDDPKSYIDHYDYNPNGKPIPIEREDVVHFRNGLDPNNVRMGLSPFGALLREIATDEEAAEYTVTVLRNQGVAGMIISPLNERVKLSQPDADRIKASVMTRTQGDRRGEPLVLAGAARAEMMGVDPSKFDLAGIRHIPEERITAMFGTPAILLGLGTGLENATYSNVDGLRKIYYENEVIPTQELISGDLDTQLLPDFVGIDEQDKYRTQFDNEKVRVLKDDETAVVTRIATEMEHGILTAGEARQLRGRKPLGDDFYTITGKVKVVAVEKILEQPAQMMVDQNGQPVPHDSTGKPIPPNPAANNTNDGTNGANDSANSSGKSGPHPIRSMVKDADIDSGPDHATIEEEDTTFIDSVA
jgi:HK97 family phage portal protein